MLWSISFEAFLLDCRARRTYEFSWIFNRMIDEGRRVCACQPPPQAGAKLTALQRYNLFRARIENLGGPIVKKFSELC
jgi:hypothetical protein